MAPSLVPHYKVNSDFMFVLLWPHMNRCSLGGGRMNPQDDIKSPEILVAPCCGALEERRSG